MSMSQADIQALLSSQPADGKEAATSTQTESTASNQITTPVEKQTTPSGALDYDMAKRESLGFFTDISQEHWLLRKELTKARQHNGNKNPTQPMKTPAAWYQTNWDPDFACFHEDSIGGNDDGHKWVCDPHRLNQYQDCLIYSFGSNRNFHFEGHLQKVAPNCEIHIFDPTDYSKQMANFGGLERATYHAWGLKASYNQTNPEDSTTKFSARFEKMLEKDTFKTLAETMEELGHTGRRIDVFKIDCEGCEWKTFQDFLRQDMRQILIEVHDFCRVTNDFFQELHDNNFVMFHKEPNIQWSNGNCVEFSFLRLDQSYFA